MHSEAATILAINGSERAGGNTDLAIEYAGRLISARGATLRTIRLREHQISPCSPCGDCNSRTTLCQLDDDVPALVEQMIHADGLIYAAPVHAFGLAHLMQVFIERAGVGYLRFNRPLADKVGGVIVTGRRYSDSSVHNQIVNNLLLNRMILVGSGFPVLLRNATGKPGLADTEGVDALERMVNRMLDMVHLLRQHQRVTGGSVLPQLDRNERVPRPRPGGFVPTRGDIENVH
ncbi:Multimeric flavodoxin WrbA [Micromonospora phaseoli]|uniref:Multimeric flavodoxin WrbA n=1 Tax=Micromonospora phaseoli TaxID=1144548 RepID=A0A1H6VFY9_9ACTN|nr:flavodoxin family protein [Micromonospora phaseoli]PZV93723.1 multimeric flavodoxin WrbA [Micromonospora phaseoli]GIJ79204.1 FMN reductase [Micromonospora phaseoli]SEI99242.1 Multimeric flavodoxin WrbA [Micromonospora phaseoli]